MDDVAYNLNFFIGTIEAPVNVRKKGDNPKNLEYKMGCGAANPLQRTAQWGTDIPLVLLKL